MILYGEDDMTVKELKDLLNGFDDYATVKINFGSTGQTNIDNSPILDVKEVGQSRATSIVYLKANYSLN